MRKMEDCRAAAATRSATLGLAHAVVECKHQGIPLHTSFHVPVYNSTRHTSARLTGMYEHTCNTASPSWGIGSPAGPLHGVS
jgi:hypothetical protein